MAWSVYGTSWGGLGPGMTGSRTSGTAPISVANEVTATLDRILEQAQNGVVGAQRDFWKLVMDRPNWIFLCNPQQAKELMDKPEAERGNAQPQPLLWKINDKTMIGVFTSESAALETHRQMHNATPETPNDALPNAAMLSMPVPEAIAWLNQIPADRVSDIVVNRRQNVTVAHMPIANLPGLYEWSMDAMPDILWDHFIKGVQDANQPGAWGRLRRRFALLNTWWLPADPGGSNTPLVVMDGDRKFLALATFNGAAGRAFQTIVGKDAKPRIGPVDRMKLLQLLDALSAEPEGPKDVAINLGGRPAVIQIAELAKILREPLT